MLKHSPPLPRLASVVLASLFLALTACPGNDDPPDSDGGTTLPDGGPAGDGGHDAGPLQPDGGPYDPGAAVCGDGKLQVGEVCDDGNTQSGDGCRANCLEVESGYACPVTGQACVKAAACGNGLLEQGEACDDRNTTSGDGCSADCKTVEAGWTCPLQGLGCKAAACGDGIIAGDEECEDGNAVKGDGCSDVCRLEAGYKCDVIGQKCTTTTCGDGKKEGTEQCDDGNNDMGDGCSPLCVLEPRCVEGNCEARCGDGVILPGDTTEECDDGNLRANDGCSPTCKLEPGFACVRVTESPPNEVKIPVVYRDFCGIGGNQTCTAPATAHPDFEDKNGAEQGIVGPLYTSRLTNGKPTYAKASGGTNTTFGKARFDQWYRDTPNVNVTEVGTLTLVKQGTSGSYVFNNQTFFPLDNSGWVGRGLEKKLNDNSNPSVARNFSFTSETRYWFEFKGTEVLTFLGDDDVWVYINGRLALDLGGVHGATSGTVSLSNASVASSLGLVKGKIYEVVVFQAERHTSASSYRLTLTNFETQRTECKSTCGNGTLDPGEQCDQGNNNGPGYGKCSLTCIWNARCGDGILQKDDGEECDDGNTEPRDGCSATCRVEIG
jgi:fibro-slime domain-containing protein